MPATIFDRCSRLPTRNLSGAALLVLAGLLAGCGGKPLKASPPQEKFGSVETYSRLFDAKPAQTCEAARRALLSQGYIVNQAGSDQVEGSKNFQPEPESHLQMTIRVVCVPEDRAGQVSLAFVSAVQDRYALKKASSAASLGVGAIGSVSLPLSSGSESMIKVGSETIAADRFYESFFELIRRYLVVDRDGED